MAKEITDKQLKLLVAELKKNPGNSERHYAEASGIPMGQIGAVLYKAEVEADPKLKIPASGAAIAKARENGVRWPRIVARTGKTMSEVKTLFEDHTGTKASESWTGRGRRFDGTGSPAKAGTSGRRGAGNAKTAGAKRGTSGRRGAAAAKTTPKRGATPKRGTAGRRGTRAAATSDPK